VNDSTVDAGLKLQIEKEVLDLFERQKFNRSFFTEKRHGHINNNTNNNKTNKPFLPDITHPLNLESVDVREIPEDEEPTDL